MFLALIVVTELWVHTYLQICYVVYIKYAQLYACQLYFNKVTVRVVKKPTQFMFNKHKIDINFLIVLFLDFLKCYFITKQY